MQQERIIVLDFGGQYKQLIARRVRECNVYCEIHPHTLSIEKIREMNPKGIIMTGGPASVYDEKSPTCSPELFEMGIPVLGICYGSQLMAYRCGAAHAVDGSHGKKHAEKGGASVDENAQAGYAARHLSASTAGQR